MSSKLVLFTAGFPYGKGEAFLENEINILAANFDEVFILPSGNAHKNERYTPKNVIVIPDINFKKEISILRLIKCLDLILPVFLWSLLFDKKRQNYFFYYKSMLDYAYQDLCKYRKIRSIIQRYRLMDAIIYDYWLVNHSLSLVRLKKNKIIRKVVVCRAHRFDLYDEVHVEGVVPFKSYKLRNVDKVVLISKNGYEYLLNQFPDYKEKFSISYLGIDENKVFPIDLKAPFDGMHFVSCARIIPSKKVGEIPDLLETIKDARIKWTHFGEGPLSHDLKKRVETLPENITVELKGNVSNKSLHEFYSSNYIDAFISLSESEGLPVSMMEAIFYGVPLFAFDCNGVSEIVNAKTGYLLRTKENVWHEFEFFLVKLREGGYRREEIQEFAKNKFKAQSNYQEFCEILKGLNSKNEEKRIW